MAAHGCGGRVEHLSVCGKVNGGGRRQQARRPSLLLGERSLTHGWQIPASPSQPTISKHSHQ